MPLNDLEVRVLELSGGGTVATSTSNEGDQFLADDSDSEPLENIKVRAAPPIKVRQSIASISRSSIGNINYFIAVSFIFTRALLIKQINSNVLAKFHISQ